MSDAGLVPASTLDLSPKSGEADEQLTVTIWLAGKPEASAKPAQNKGGAARAAVNMEDAR